MGGGGGGAKEHPASLARCRKAVRMLFRPTVAVVCSLLAAAQIVRQPVDCFVAGDIGCPETDWSVMDMFWSTIISNSIADQTPSARLLQAVGRLGRTA